MDSEPTLTLDTLMEACRKVKEMGPTLGAVLAVEWWPQGRSSWVVTVDKIDEFGWRLLDAMVGKEGVDLVKRHSRQQVCILAAADLDKLPTTQGDASTMLFGPKVYRLRNAPEWTP